MNTNMINVIKMRSKEKEILHLCLQVCEWTINFLQMKKSEAQELMGERETEGSMSQKMAWYIEPIFELLEE